MRSFSTLLAMVAVLAVLPALASAQLGAAQVSAVTITPQPVEPGADVTVTVSYYNPTASAIASFNTELVLADAFTLKAQTFGLSPGASLCAYCTADNSYFLHVDPTAATGVYRLQAKVVLGTFTSVRNVDIEVRGKPNLQLQTAMAGLDLLQPDQRLELVLDVENIGSGPAYEVSVVPSSTEVIAIGSGRRSVPEVPRGGAGTVTIPVVVSAATTPGTYQLPFIITYKDSAGVTNSTQQSIGVRVVEAGKLAVQNVKVTDPKGQPLRAGPATIIVRIENTGFGDAEAVRATLSCPFNGGGKTAFLGRLRPDEDGPAVFDFENAPAGESKCSLSVSYEDDLGEHEQSEELKVVAGGADMSGLVGPIVLVLIVLGFLFRKRLLKLAGRKAGK